MLISGETARYESALLAKITKLPLALKELNYSDDVYWQVLWTWFPTPYFKIIGFLLHRPMRSHYIIEIKHAIISTDRSITILIDVDISFWREIFSYNLASSRKTRPRGKESKTPFSSRRHNMAARVLSVLFLVKMVPGYLSKLKCLFPAKVLNLT